MKAFNFNLESKAGLIDSIVVSAKNKKEAKKEASKILFSELKKNFPLSNKKSFYVM